MPALSPTMEEGKLVKWHVREGDAVRAGDVIAEIETDKATMEVEAVDDGQIGKILVAEGTEHVPVNKPIALLLTDGEPTAQRGRSRVATARRGRCAVPKRPSRSRRPISREVAPTRARRRRSSRRQPVAPRQEPKPEAEVPPGTEMVTMTVREALRDAMAEEMRPRSGGVPHGRGGRPISGRLQGHPGPAR